MNKTILILKIIFENFFHKNIWVRGRPKKAPKNDPQKNDLKSNLPGHVVVLEPKTNRNRVERQKYDLVCPGENSKKNFRK